MLAFFTIRRTFYKLRVTMHVDCERKSADVVVTYDRRIVVMQIVAFHEVDSIEKAERWFSALEADGTASRLEWLESYWRRREALTERAAS